MALLKATITRGDRATKVRLAQQSWANGISAAITGTIEGISGKCSQISVKVNNNTGNRTLTLTIADELDGTLFTQAAIAENATTIYKLTGGAADSTAFLCAGTLTITLTPSGDPGESGMTTDILLLLE